MCSDQEGKRTRRGGGGTRSEPTWSRAHGYNMSSFQPVAKRRTAGKRVEELRAKHPTVTRPGRGSIFAMAPGTGRAGAPPQSAGGHWQRHGGGWWTAVPETVFGTILNAQCLTGPKLGAGGIRVGSDTVWRRFAAADASLARRRKGAKTVAALTFSPLRDGMKLAFATRIHSRARRGRP